MTLDQIDALFERLSPKPKKDDCTYGYFSFLNDWMIKREGFRQAMGMLELIGTGCNAMSAQPGDKLYRIREDRK